MKRNKIIAVIPARGGSKGIPGKNLIQFCGKPLIAWSIKQALGSKHIEDVYVSSDDREILRVSKDSGAKIIRRPKKLATDTVPVEEALLHAINYIERFNKNKIDIVVFLQATSPLRTSKDINSAIELFISQKADSLFSVAVLKDFCVWEKKGTGLNSLTFNYKNRRRRQERKPYYLENGSIYIFKPHILRRRKNRLGGRIVIYEMPFWKSFEIDDKEDLEICKYFMEKNLKTRIIE